MRLHSQVHSFSPEIAMKINVNAAIVLGQIKYFMNVAKQKKYRATHFKEGRWWAKTSVRRLHEHMPYLSESSIKRAIKLLEDAGMLISRQFKKYKYDHTKYYTIDQKKVYATINDIKSNSSN